MKPEREGEEPCRQGVTVPKRCVRASEPLIISALHFKPTLFIFFLFVSNADAKRKKTEPKERKTRLLIRQSVLPMTAASSRRNGALRNTPVGAIVVDALNIDN